MIGRRIEDNGQDPYLQLKEAGDYLGPITRYTGDRPAVFFLLPIEGERIMAHVCMPPHKFHENDDGTLSITESILTKRDVELWHGHLTKGEWVRC
jgi:hypothetical protein